MEFSPATHRHISRAGLLFGLALAAALTWSTQVAPALALQGVPVDAASYGLSRDLLAAVIAINVVGIPLGASLVARLWERMWAGLLAGAALTAAVQVATAYIVTTASLENNRDAELILFRLPLGLLIGGVIWLAGGLAGSVIERLALRAAVRLFDAPRLAALGYLLLALLGAALGLVAGGDTDRREANIAAARAVDVALRSATGRPVTSGDEPRGYAVSDPARETLAALRDHAGQPYQVAFDSNDGREVVTLVRFADGAGARCVSTGPHISRCFREGS